MQPLKNCLIQTIPDPNLSNINHADWSIPATKNFLSTPVIPDHLYTFIIMYMYYYQKKGLESWYYYLNCKFHPLPK